MEINGFHYNHYLKKFSSNVTCIRVSEKRVWIQNILDQNEIVCTMTLDLFPSLSVENWVMNKSYPFWPFLCYSPCICPWSEALFFQLSVQSSSKAPSVFLPCVFSPGVDVHAMLPCLFFSIHRTCPAHRHLLLTMVLVRFPLFKFVPLLSHSVLFVASRS